MGELFAYPRLIDVEMRRVDLSTNEREKSMLKNGDLIFARRSLTAEGAGKCSLVYNINEETTFESSIIRARVNQKIASPEFLYYYFNSHYGKYLLGTILRQVAVAGITGKDLMELILNIPVLETQLQIASLLSSLDNKIDLLHRQIKTLEQLAETIFRQWFVEEAEEGWEFGKLEDIAKFHNGKSRPKETELGKIPIYGGNGILGYTNQSNYSGISIIIGRVGAYCGSLYIETKPIWLSDNALLARDKQNNNFFLFYLLKRLELNSWAEGSSHPLLTQTLLNSIDIVIPPNEKIKEFEAQSKEFWSKIYKNIAQINTLIQIRDTLLPKLMSGEMTVKY
jgi:type I restriction enzyme S subunit